MNRSNQVEMDRTNGKRWVAFAGSRLIRSGLPAEVAIAAKGVVDADSTAAVLVFDESSRIVDIDFRGTPEQVAARVEPNEVGDGAPDPQVADTSPYRDSPAPRGRGRPRLGVVAREVTLLPRHWDWLAKQPGGASAAVRRLIDSARQSHANADRLREAKESAYRFMSAMAGNEPGFEEATRALFAGNAERFAEMTASWPRDVRNHARDLSASVWNAVH